MIKIIEDGHIKFTKRCPKCNCLFEYEAEDVTKKVVWDDHGGHYPVTHFYEIHCPFCNELIDLDKYDENLKKMEDKMIKIDD